MLGEIVLFLPHYIITQTPHIQYTIHCSTLETECYGEVLICFEDVTHVRMACSANLKPCHATVAPSGGSKDHIARIRVSLVLFSV